MNIINIIIQARMSSSRLPNKVIKEVDDSGLTVIELIVLRLLKVRGIDKVIVATSTSASDDMLVKKISSLNIPIVRGDLDDVFSRFRQVINEYRCDHFIRITGDCPFVDPELIEELIERHIFEGNDYTSTALIPTYPDGLDAECVKVDAFESINAELLTSIEKEHVTYHLYNNQNIFKVGGVQDDDDFSHIRLTLDESEDLIMIKKIISDVGVKPVEIKYSDIKRFIKECGSNYFSNSHIKRNEGLEISIRKGL